MEAGTKGSGNSLNVLTGYKFHREQTASECEKIKHSFVGVGSGDIQSKYSFSEVKNFTLKEH